jgi:hypothetical protein
MPADELRAPLRRRGRLCSGHDRAGPEPLTDQLDREVHEEDRELRGYGNEKLFHAKAPWIVVTQRVASRLPLFDRETTSR